MSERKSLEPSALPPDPSIGELVTEIDRARHDAAHTVNELSRRLDPRTKVPEPVRNYTRTAIGYAKQVPMSVWITAAVVFMLALRRRGKDK
jgi:hypothetical protein